MPSRRTLLVDGWEEPVMQVQAGDTAPIAFTLCQDGSPFDLTGATDGKIFWMDTRYWTGRDWYGPPGSAVLGSRFTESDEDGESVTLTTDTTGIATFYPASDDWDVPGQYYLGIRVLKGGYYYHFPTNPEDQQLRVHQGLDVNDGDELG